jgi:5-methylcytosine-specific restriction enzyme subunit McrC
LLYFEEIGDCTVHEQLFNQIFLNRKTERYSEALGIARLILLNYHPDISRGSNHVLALMFDMNKLWEGFITKMMKRHLSSAYHVKSQSSKVFWRSEVSRSKLQPDILLIHKDGLHKNIIVDTKWKTPNKRKPSDDDLKQIFSYNQLFTAGEGVLLYPGKNNGKMGKYEAEPGGVCSMEFINVLEEDGKLNTSKELLSQWI